MDYAFFGLLIYVIFREVLIQRERRDWTQERRLLIMRVQAPEVAVRLDAEETRADAPPTPALPYDDDDAYWRLRQGQEAGH